MKFYYVLAFARILSCRKKIKVNLKSLFEQKLNNDHFFPYKSLSDQTCPWRKMGQDQPRVIILIILIELAYLMLYTKFQVHPSISSVEEDF